MEYCTGYTISSYSRKYIFILEEVLHDVNFVQMSLLLPQSGADHPISWQPSSIDPNAVLFDENPSLHTQNSSLFIMPVSSIPHQ